MLFVVLDPETEKNHIYQNLKMKKIIKERLYTHKPGETPNLKTKT